MGNVLARTRDRRMRQQADRCFYCDQPMWRGSDADFCARFGITPRRAALFQCTAEHLVARSDGGGNGAGNIVAACRFCNGTRHRARVPKPPEAYRAFVRKRLAKGGWQRLGPGLA